MKLVFSCIMIFCCCWVSAQQEQDSISTPFKQGRWLTGFSGSISSSSLEVPGSDEKIISNRYGFDISTGKYVKDRLLVGGTLQASRNSSGGNVNRTAESIFIGPFSNYYISKSELGSIFTNVALGYVRYTDETIIAQTQLNNSISEASEGGGIGSILGLGYSYVINDRIAFDIGLNVNLFWLSLEQESLPSNIVNNEDVFVSDVVFSFGFNVLLDDFFF